MADKNQPRQTIIEPNRVTTPADAPEIPLPPSGVFKWAILTAIKYGGVRKAYESYSAAIEAKQRSITALAGVHDAKLQLGRAIRRLDEIDTILATDSAIRADARAEAEHELKVGRLRRERERLQEEVYLHRTRQQHAKLFGADPDINNAELDEVTAAYKEGIAARFVSPNRIHEETEKFIQEYLKDRGRGEDELTDEDRAWIEEIRKYERDFIRSIQKDDDEGC